MPRVLEHCTRVFFQRLHTALSGRTVDHPRLTETAAADTSPLDLKHDSVLRGFDIGNDRLHRIRSIGHIHDYLLPHFRRSRGIVGNKGSDRAVFVVCHIIKLRYIEPLDPGCLAQELLP